MTRSIFDPGGDPERSGSAFRAQEAGDRSHLPADATDGDVSAAEARDADAVAAADAAGLTPAERIAAIPPDPAVGRDDDAGTPDSDA